MMEEDRVSMRDLRQHFSAHLRRVKAGERLVITQRGRPVAMLVPLPTSASVVDRLVAKGRARPAKGSLSDLPPPLKVHDPDISAKIRQALDETRADTI
jgi:prevent-host-death family protein